MTPPEGYKPLWEDDRLNIHRAEQTISGRSATNLVWTSTLPRRLIDRRTGRDVTASTALVYPYTDQTTQSRELGSVQLVQTSDGRVGKRVIRNR